MQTTTFTAPDIVCGGCANAIKKAMGAQPGVTHVEVDIRTKAITVQHEATVSSQALTETLAKAGFPVAP